MTVRARLTGRRSGRRHLSAAVGQAETRAIGTAPASGLASAFAELVAAINEVDRLRRLGVRGAALTRAIERIGRQLNLPASLG